MPLYYGSGAHVGDTTYGNIGSHTRLDFTVIGLLRSTWLRVSRVFLMGDAVRQTPPFPGQGLCAGIRDAANWACKLALVLRGNADDSMLDSYETERKPHVRAAVASAKQFGKIIGETVPPI